MFTKTVICACVSQHREMIDTNGAMWEMDVQTFQKSFGMPPDKVVYPLKIRVQAVKGKIV